MTVSKTTLEKYIFNILVPDYYGWTHSDSADSWYLEAHTPSIHDNYESFYDEALKKKVICPKFYSCV